MPLITDPNVASPDDLYQMLVDAHRSLSPAQSRLFNAKLILLLANHVGDLAVLAEAIAAAGEGIDRTTPEADLRVTA